MNGYGRVGQLVSDLLERRKVDNIAVDSNARIGPNQPRRGRKVYLGGAFDPEFLMICGPVEAKAVIVAIFIATDIDAIVARLGTLRPDVIIVSRVRDGQHAQHLYAIGVTDAVPTTFETNLQLSKAVLLGLGQATRHPVASIHERRDENRRELQ